MIVTTPAGLPLQRVFGPAWRPLAQTAPAAEWMAYVLANKFVQPALRASTVAHIDCKAVVDAIAAPRRALSAAAQHAGMYKTALKDAAGLSPLGATKVKAHCLGPDLVGDELV